MTPTDPTTPTQALTPQPKSKHVMIDLETMGTRPDAAIVSIGAVVFDVHGCGAEFYSPVNLESAMADGGTADADTICWWMGQSEKARKLFENNSSAPPILVALISFTRWLHKVAGSESAAQDLEIWGNGSDFDNVILASAYRRSHMHQPWGKYKNRCYRTVKSDNRHIKLERQGTHHNALDDAISQAQHLREIWLSTARPGAPA